jgi:cell wall-associated NlpC family hydrolase
VYNIDKFMNAKYVKDGRTYKEIDCYGICYLFNRDFLSKSIPEFPQFRKSEHLYKEIKLGKELTGDIISFNIKGQPIHVGVVVEKGMMLHIMENRETSYESYTSFKWKKRVNSIWRYESIK